MTQTVKPKRIRPSQLDQLSKLYAEVAGIRNRLRSIYAEMESADGWRKDVHDDIRSNVDSAADELSCYL